MRELAGRSGESRIGPRGARRGEALDPATEELLSELGAIAPALASAGRELVAAAVRAMSGGSTSGPDREVRRACASAQAALQQAARVVRLSPVEAGALARAFELIAGIGARSATAGTSPEVTPPCPRRAAATGSRSRRGSFS